MSERGQRNQYRFVEDGKPDVQYLCFNKNWPNAIHNVGQQLEKQGRTCEPYAPLGFNFLMYNDGLVVFIGRPEWVNDWTDTTGETEVQKWHGNHWVLETSTWPEGYELRPVGNLMRPKGI